MTNSTQADLKTLSPFMRAAIRHGMAATGSLEERAAAAVSHALTAKGVTRAALAVAASIPREELEARVRVSILIRTPAPKATRPQTRRGSKEWRRMWALLGTEFGDTVQDHDGENWQYMGQTLDGQHEFRHRAHPVHGRIVWSTPVAVAS